ncbi:MAG: PDZ domain-containing protein [Planctomycetota bacterium]|nr:MAG: PDZ domain-containing protein [Planctomycetota bacterium]
MRRPWITACAALAVLGLSGCQSLFDETFTLMNAYQAEDPERPFLGIVVPRQSIYGRGVPIERVLAGSPAQEAGLAPGDKIVRYGAHRVRSASDLAKSIREVGTHTTVEVAVDQGPKQPPRLVEITPEREELYADYANRYIKVHKNITNLPFLFRSSSYSVDSVQWLAYTGFPLPHDALLYEEFALLPVFSFALVRFEDTDIHCDATRITLLHWPLSLTAGGGSDTDIQSSYNDFRERYVRL